MSATIVCREQRLRAADGLPVRCVTHAPSDAPADVLPLVVICHGFKGFADWGMFPPLAERLATAGRQVLRFDYSHNGVAELSTEFTRLDRFAAQTVSRHLADLELVLDELAGRRRAWLVGHSLGGGVALLAAARRRDIAGVATLNGVAHFHRVGAEGLAQLEQLGHVEIPNARTGQLMRLGRAWFDDLPRTELADALPRVEAPVLVVQAELDTTVLPAEAATLVGGLPDAHLVSVPGGDHTFGARHPWVGWTPPLLAALDALQGFLPRGVQA